MGIRDFFSWLGGSDAPRRGGRSAGPGPRQGKRPGREPDEHTVSIRAGAHEGRGRPNGGAVNPVPANPLPVHPTPDPRSHLEQTHIRRTHSSPTQPSATSEPAPRREPRHSAPPPPPHAVHEPGDATIYETQSRARTGLVGVLAGLEGPNAGLLFPIVDGENRLGRSPECEIQFSSEDRHISRVHARIEYRGGYFAVEPVDEKTLLVNQTGERPERQDAISGMVRLEDGARIYIGRSEFRFRTI